MAINMLKSEIKIAGTTKGSIIHHFVVEKDAMPFRCWIWSSSSLFFCIAQKVSNIYIWMHINMWIIPYYYYWSVLIRKNVYTSFPTEMTYLRTSSSDCSQYYVYVCLCECVREGCKEHDSVGAHSINIYYTNTC